MLQWNKEQARGGHKKRKKENGPPKRQGKTKRAPANAPVVHGDKEKPELTRQYNEGYKARPRRTPRGPGRMR